jgi:DsbC/DsbD-like thiol-disulfide interchange protein
MLALAALQVGALPANPSHVSLVAADRAVCPGSSFDVAVRFQMDPGWHIYWQNPGESGQSPTVAWDLPKGWHAGPIRWPTPERLDTQGVVTYTYEREALLLIQMKVSPNARPGTATLRANAKWLVCREGCIPVQAKLSIPVKVTGRSMPDPVWGPRLAAAEAQLPKSTSSISMTAARAKDSVDLTVTLANPDVPSFDPGKYVYGKTGTLPTTFTFFPADTAIEPSAPQPETRVGNDRVLRLKVSSYAPASVERLRGLLVTPTGTSWRPGVNAITVDIPIRRTNS